MPSRVDDYEELVTIGSGSYGRCRKIRRKSDGKVSKLKPYSLLPPESMRENGYCCLKFG